MQSANHKYIVWNWYTQTRENVQAMNFMTEPVLCGLFIYLLLVLFGTKGRKCRENKFNEKRALVYSAFAQIVFSNCTDRIEVQKTTYIWYGTNCVTFYRRLESPL